MKRTNNKIVKVWSHPRSGTNLLCALLYINFYAGRNMSGDKEVKKDYFVSDTGEVLLYSKWAKLFGGHHPAKPKGRRCRLSSSIYIKRDVVATARSWYNRDYYRKKYKVGDIGFDVFLKKRMFGRRKKTIVQYIKTHHENWRKTGIYTIQYKDLVESPVKVISGIGQRFG